VVLLLLVAFFGWRYARHRDPPPPPETDLSTLDPPRLIRRATELVTRGQSYAALPIYRRLLVLSARKNASVHCAYAIAIYNSMFYSDSSAGSGRPVWRTSDTRVALMNECVSQLDSAIALAQSSRERAVYEVRLAIIQGVWGFQWEADDAFRRAALDDPSNASFTRMARENHDELRNPLATHVSASSPPATDQVVDSLGLRLR
jgi:hypothetical protein